MEIALLADMVRELILDNEEVSLPGLGTFVTEIEPATFSDRGYTINPPYRRLSFRERQGSDDKLAALYSKANGTDLETSRKIVSGFISAVREELMDRKVVALPGLGRLRATKENAFFFIPDEDLEIFPYGFGLQPVSLKTHEETPEEVRSAVDKLSDMVTSVQPEPSVTEPVPEPSAEKDVEVVVAAENQLVDEGVPAAKPAAMTSESPESVHEDVVQNQMSRKRRGGWHAAAVATASMAGFAVLLFIIFIILSRTVPSFTDSILYSPEELEIINAPDE